MRKLSPLCTQQSFNHAENVKLKLEVRRRSALVPLPFSVVQYLCPIGDLREIATVKTDMKLSKRYVSLRNPVVFIFKKRAPVSAIPCSMVPRELKN